MKIDKSIRTKLQSYETIEERLNFLKGMFEGDTAYLISCGPTLTQHDKEILNKKLKKKLVLCAKQSLNYFNDICDFHNYFFIWCQLIIFNHMNIKIQIQ